MTRLAGALLPLAEPAVTAGQKKRAGRSGVRHRKITPYLFLIVPLAFLITFTYVPAANLIWFSVTDWDGIDKTKNIVGADNFIEIFTDPEVFRVFYVSLFYIAASFIQMGLALYFATVLSFSTRFRNLFKGILFFPYLINGVAIGLMFLYFFQPDGTLDSLLKAVGLQEVTTQWLGNPDAVNPSLAATSVWRYTGLNFVLFLGAIQSIPSQLYEAADLDGANRFQQFRFIIVPGIKRIISLSFILAISGSLAVFEIPFIMTGGANGSATFVIETIRQAFTFRQVGLASAMAVVLLVIVLIVTLVQRKLLPDDEVNLT
ncbi:carbohydrate ABC transporter permease [Subtercola boreus]|uniref:carbohydrate ABC transporter permease n=1 Tax=Subtercola boreus TaxID=120213 RepID=UPI00209BC2F6|nr:sugar ABC transporter permease [Subtercola boreus]